MTNKFAFFRGCFIPIRLPHIEYVARRVFEDLGITLVDLKDFTCCPEPVGFGINDKLTWLSIAARNICLAEEVNRDIITLCNGCLYTLKQANVQLKANPELKDKINGILSDTGHQFRGSIKVKHFLEVLNEDIGINKLKEYVTVPLTGLTVASHLGCHIISPIEIMNFDDPYDPVVLDGITASLGATPADYDLKSLCCGWTLFNYGTRESAANLISAKLKDMKKAGADCLTVVCPQCFHQFDMGQLLASRETALGFRLPVLFLLQLLGLAMGYDLKKIQYRFHRIKDESFEKKVVSR